MGKQRLHNGTVGVYHGFLFLLGRRKAYEEEHSLFRPSVQVTKDFFTFSRTFLRHLIVHTYNHSAAIGRGCSLEKEEVLWNVLFMVSQDQKQGLIKEFI